ATQALFMAHVHAATYEHGTSRVRQDLPHPLGPELVAFIEVKQSMRTKRQPCMDGHPLNPGLQIRWRLLGVRDEALGFIAQTLKVRKMSGGNETVHQLRSQFVELEKDDTRFLCHICRLAGFLLVRELSRHLGRHRSRLTNEIARFE